MSWSLDVALSEAEQTQTLHIQFHESSSNSPRKLNKDVREKAFRP
jgi:hypothetical protein